MRKKYKKFIYGIVFALLLILTIVFFSNQDQEIKVINAREPAYAGSWYPGTESEATKTLDEYFLKVEKVESVGKIKALIVPHAGWVWSGFVAAVAYGQLNPDDFDKVILVGPSHRANYVGVSIANVTHFKSPLGLVSLSEDVEKIKLDLEKEGLYVDDHKIHEKEHSLEVQIPFLQKQLNEFAIIPVTIGPSTSFDNTKKIAEILKQYIDDNTLIIVSSDFTHYGSNYGYIPFTTNISENIKKIDFGALELITKLDADGFYEYCDVTGATICGRIPIMVLLNILDEEIESTPLTYATSGQISGDYTNSVSYFAISFSESEKEPLSKTDQEFLLSLARNTVESYVKEKKVPVVNEDLLSEELTKVQGCFVTLNKEGRLRGCIGHIIPNAPLYKCVLENAVNAASNDRRFNPVSESELDSIHIDISVLSVPEELPFTSGDDLLSKLRPNIDGVVLKSGFAQSTYLPQVWENFNSKEDFLSSLCQKGGAVSTCWTDTSTSVLTYQAFVFEE